MYPLVKAFYQLYNIILTLTFNIRVFGVYYTQICPICRLIVHVVSNIDDGIGMLYRLRMRIDEAFRDLKTLFGFKHLKLKDTQQSRVERILMLVFIGMGLLSVLFQKSGYRWSKYFNTSCRKEYSLIHVIKHRISVSWVNLCTTPWFPLYNAVFYRA